MKQINAEVSVCFSSKKKNLRYKTKLNAEFSQFFNQKKPEFSQLAE